MPFTPKFVDMVRNLTTSTGTGAVNPGSAVPGFTSLSAAIATGEQFYYCIQGVEKPAEREVGRGTMQANGTIARQTISGALINFTTGTKTIALVTAAEWFAKVEAGGSGGNGVVSVMDFGAVGNGIADDLPAFEAALAYLKTKASAQNPTLHKQVPKLYVPTPAHHYYLSGALNINVCVHMFGDGSGAPNSSGTLLRFGDNCSGIIVNEYRTYGNGLGSVGDGSGSLIEGFTLYSGNIAFNGTAFTIFGDGSSATGHGVNVRGTGVRLQDIQCFFWPENGIYIHADSGGSASENGNANNWRIQDIWCQYNDGCGVRVYGLDANSGVGHNVNAISNRVAGIFDQSFLGNTWIQPHTRDNGIISYTGLNLPTGMCSYPTAGSCYSVAWGKNALASTTVPGTNNLVWLPTAASHPSAKPWVTGMTWEVGAPYLITNQNARTTFINPYAESAQGPCQAAGATLFLHGLMALGDDPIAGIDGLGKGVYVSSGSGSWNAPKLTAVSTASYLGGDAYFGIDGAGFTHKITQFNAAGRVSWGTNNGGSGGAVLAIHPFADDFSLTLTASRLRVSPFAAPNAADGGYGLNFITSIAQIGVTDLLLHGDVFFRQGAAIGDNLGWYVTASGTGGPGSRMAEFGCVGATQPKIVGGVTYTAIAEDARRHLRFTNAAAVSFTIPPNSAAAFPIGTEISGLQAGTGATTLVAGAGVVLNAFGADLTLAGQWAGFTAKKVAPDEWDVVGKF